MGGGLDGLTQEELRASRRGFWDEAFSALLLSRIGEGNLLLVDVGCGLATATHALLPHRPSMRYLGVDADPARLEAARADLASTPWRDRATFVSGRAEQLPLRDGEADVALVAMTLQHLADPDAALSELHRVLRPGGRLVAVEPDNLGARFYLDGDLPALDEAFRGLAARVRQARRPADIALGTTLARRVALAGFDTVEARVHAAQTTRRETASDFATRLRRIVETMASQGALPRDGPQMARCLAAIDALSEGNADEPRFATHMVPLFVCVGDRSA